MQKSFEYINKSNKHLKIDILQKCDSDSILLYSYNLFFYSILSICLRNILYSVIFIYLYLVLKEILRNIASDHSHFFIFSLRENNLRFHDVLKAALRYKVARCRRTHAMGRIRNRGVATVAAGRFEGKEEK